jgi:XTP/dITP diphosphohydrolase
MKVVLASSNAGKIKEFKELFANFHIDLVPQSELGVTDIEETGLSFIENSLLKARHAAEVTGLPALADDSGLVVNALNGAPGIYSARYAGIQATAKDNIDKLLHELQHTPDAERAASFHCVLAFMTHALDPTPLVCEGKWSGTILRETRGKEGFGYDPVFYVPTEKITAAELSPAIKNKISHRGLALQSLLKKLPDKL